MRLPYGGGGLPEGPAALRGVRTPIVAHARQGQSTCTSTAWDSAAKRGPAAASHTSSPAMRKRSSRTSTEECSSRSPGEASKGLADQGLDAGAHTIAFHLDRRHGSSPAVSTIWRILTRRGFVTPQPQKRPKSSFIRFEAEMPNERWQAEVTHWELADGTEVEILNVIDDHSRLWHQTPG